MTPSSIFLSIFKSLRDSWETVAKDFAILEHFLRSLSKSKQKPVDSARFVKFNVTMRKEHKGLGYFCVSTMFLFFLAALLKRYVCGIEIQKHLTARTTEGRRNCFKKLFR